MKYFILFKVAASEVLHSLVLFMLGKSVQFPDAVNKVVFKFLSLAGSDFCHH